MLLFGDQYSDEFAKCGTGDERYDDAIAADKQVIAEDKCYYGDAGLKAARRHRQPDWDDL